MLKVEKLRRHEGVGPFDLKDGLFCSWRASGISKVADLNPVALKAKYVGRLDVAMHEVPGVHVLEPCHQLDCNLMDAIHRKTD